MREFLLLSCLVVTALGCGEVLEGPQGTFTSPNYPADYDNNLNCEWTISVPSGYAKISFLEFEVESQSSCTYDTVTIRDGSSNGAVLSTLCGSNRGANVTASGRTIVVQFTTDSTVTRTGFSAAWSVGDGRPVTTPPSGGQCGGVITAESGSITSPNYPNNYDSGVSCTWDISIPSGSIVFTFDDLDVEAASGCTYDSIKFYEGNNLISTICGSGQPTVETSSNSVRIVFVSDSSVDGKGFELSWSRLSCASKGLNCVADSAACGNGVLKSNLYCETGVCCEPPFNQGECGTRPAVPRLIGGMKPRIVGGQESDHHEWPWQVSLRTTSSNFHFCGGSMIEERWIVTAAHCVDGDTPSGLKVVTGEHNEAVNKGTEVDHAVEKIIMHEDYDGNGAGFPNDIALLKLRDPIVRDSFRQPICMADADEVFLGADCFITGWGNTLNSSNAGILNELHVSVWDQGVCTNRWGSSYINAGHICVGTGDTGACNGDSGGPLACEMTRNGESRWVLAGATSWGRSGCNTAGYPSVYSRVSHFRTWLLATIRSN